MQFETVHNGFQTHSLFFRLGCILSEFGVGHSHGSLHSDHHPAEEKNINVRAAFIHVVGDTVQSIGVLIAALIIKFKVILKCNWYM